MEGRGRQFALGTVALIVGFIIGFVVGDRLNNEDITTGTQTGTQTATSTQTGTQTGTQTLGTGTQTGTGSQVATGDMLTVENQSAGNIVMAATVTAADSSWVAVREEIGGALGNVLGARRVDAGEYVDVAIPLLRSTIAGNVYHVVIYRDNGDKMFDTKLDMPLVDGGNASVGGSFIAQ